jgi:all-trans-8'-apo-beta-carotenal 15,15'-oxygenase
MNAQAPTRIMPGCHLAGFEAVDGEHSYTVGADEIQGEIPAEICGTLFRNGPGRLKIGEHKYGHWFDGDGMLNAITFKDGQIHYRNRYVRTPKYVNETAAQKILYRGVGTQRPGGFLNNMFRFPGNAANTSVVYHAGKLLTLWEGGDPWELDPATLETIGAWKYDGELKRGMPFSAHGKIHPRTGAYYNFGMMGALNFYKINAEGEMVKRVKHNVGNYAMCHDFAMTDRYAVFFLCPAVFKTPVKFLLGMHSIVDAMGFDDSMPTKVVVLSLDDLSVVREFEVDPFFCFHFGNAWEEGEELCVDVCRTDKMASMDAMRDVFQDVEMEKDDSACFYRFRLNLATGEIGGHKHQGAIAGDFPMWDMRKTGLKTKYAYLASMVENGTPYSFNAVQKVDLETGQAQVYDFGPGRFTSEALFIPRHADAAEDDGWLVSVVFNAATGCSEVVLLDAANMEREVAVVPLRHHIPHGFHGFYADQTFLQEDR